MDESNTSLLGVDERVLDQLRQTSHLFNRHVIPVFSSDKSRVLAHATRPNPTRESLTPTLTSNQT